MRYAGIELRVLQKDALTHRSDLLVLKYAQNLYGVDFAAAQVAQVGDTDLPAVGEFFLVKKPAGIASTDLLFMGVESIADFGYKAVRRFSRNALSTAAELRLTVREISMTLHGPGFGLDEAEAFESEVAGVVEAIDNGRFPPDLRTVSFVELDKSRAERMRLYLGSLLEGAHSRQERTSARSSRRLDSVGYDSAARPHAFIAMPFTKVSDEILYYVISPTVRAVGLLCERMDQISFTGDILSRMKERIESARLVVADLTGANPNVYLEVGYAWGRGVPCVLLCNREADLKFDVRGQRCLLYDSMMDLERQLTAELESL